MAAFTLQEAAATALAHMAKPGRRQTRPNGCGHASAPVRRDSAEAGTFEQLFFAAPARGECDRMVRAARDALDAGRRLRRDARAAGRPVDAAQRAIAALTAGAVRVFEELCALARVNQGRVFPSYDRLAAATALGRATVARALQLLEQAGFLCRRRRFVRVEGEGAGPRYAQTSNVYRPMLPGALDRLLPRWRRPAPLPDDAAQHAAARRDELAAMHATLSCREFAQATVDGPLGRALARLGSMIDATDPEGGFGAGGARVSQPAWNPTQFTEPSAQSRTEPRRRMAAGRW